VDQAEAMAVALAQGPTRAFGRMRRLLRSSWGNDLSQQLAAETEAIKATGDTSDAARLAHRGYRTLAVERLDKVGAGHRPMTSTDSRSTSAPS
jgi:hypothetical protein